MTKRPDSLTEILLSLETMDTNVLRYKKTAEASNFKSIADYVGANYDTHLEWLKQMGQTETVAHYKKRKEAWYENIPKVPK